jgi:hypothetical protein
MFSGFSLFFGLSLPAGYVSEWGALSFLLD